jgi:UPF0755 protein
MTKKKSNKGTSPKGKRIILIICGILILIGGVACYLFWSNFLQSNTNPNIKKDTFIIIKTGSTIEDVERMLKERNILLSTTSFDFAAGLMNYKSNIHAGRYLLRPHANNKNLIKLLKSGIQVPYKLSFNGIHTKYDLSGKMSQQIEADSSSILRVIQSDSFLIKYHFDTANSLAFFIPDTSLYLYTTTTVELMYNFTRNYSEFWNEENIHKARSMGLSRAQVSTLASIVEKETNKDIEKPMIAGLYYNRLRKKGMKLEADPTIIYALGDYSKQRVYNTDLEVNSPYNTYKYEGLPPGPICIPSVASLNSVLNYIHHDFLYMCAKEDFSGYHNFAKTLAEHKQNAKRYYAELKRRNIH